MSYIKAPIREAVFDIRVDKLNISNIEDLLDIKNYLTEDFPIEKKKLNITGMLQFSPGKSIESKTHSNLIGYVFLSKNSSRQLQIRIDGFTLNILKPYEKWDTHFEIFLKLWKEYNNRFKPNKILRIATRYINRIELPFPLINFQEYLQYMPPIPTCLPQSYTNFFMQIQVPCKDPYRHVVITETIEPVANSILPFILDIDVFQELNIENSENNLSINFSKIREIKNEIFESCITDKTRELFV